MISFSRTPFSIGENVVLKKYFINPHEVRTMKLKGIFIGIFSLAVMIGAQAYAGELAYKATAKGSDEEGHPCPVRQGYEGVVEGRSGNRHFPLFGKISECRI